MTCISMADRTAVRRMITGAMIVMQGKKVMQSIIIKDRTVMRRIITELRKVMTRTCQYGRQESYAK